MTGDSVALDTSAAIALMKGSGETLPAAPAAGVLLPVPVIGELRYGALNSTRSTENLAIVERLVSRCRALAITATTAATYARLRVRLKQTGRPIPENDLWIAALCVQHRVALLTFDRHFDDIEGLERRTP